MIQIRPIKILKSSSHLLLSPHPTGYVSSRASSCTPACQFCKKPPQFFKKNTYPNRWTLTLSIYPLRPPRRRALSVPPPRRHLPSPSPSLAALRRLFLRSAAAAPPTPTGSRSDARRGSEWEWRRHYSSSGSLGARISPCSPASTASPHRRWDQRRGWPRCRRD
jgi:hypothetical protein